MSGPGAVDEPSHALARSFDESARAPCSRSTLELRLVKGRTERNADGSPRPGAWTLAYAIRAACAGRGAGDRAGHKRRCRARCW